MESRANELPGITFTLDREELTDEAIAVHGRLSSGPLFGELATPCSESEWKAIRESRIGDSEYVAVAERVLSLLIPPLAKLVGVLRVDYGQYWLREISSWDSRTSSIGMYCRSMEMRWTDDGGTTWSDFQPNPLAISGTLNAQILDSYRSYITQDEWLRLGTAVRSFPIESVALKLITRSRQLEDGRNELRLAVVEVVTASEVAITEYLSRNSADKEFLKKVFAGFDNLKGQEKFFVVASALAGVERAVLEAAAPAWSFRHEIVHNGWQPQERDDRAIRDAIKNLRTAVARVLGRGWRQVEPDGQAMATPERWDELESKQQRAL